MLRFLCGWWLGYIKLRLVRKQAELTALEEFVATYDTWPQNVVDRFIKLRGEVALLKQCVEDMQ